MTTSDGCDKCKKNSLSLLLLRPSPIGLGAGTNPFGSENVKSDAAAVAGLLPARLPTQSRFVTRMLRPGYLHVYIENTQSAPVWKIYRVTEDADLIPESDALFTQPKARAICSAPEHIRAGRKLLTIPQAHQVKSVWIAFSGNLWSDKIKARNKAKGPAMQQFSLAGGSPNTFAPTAENLKTKVLEFGIEPWAANTVGMQRFKFSGYKKEEVSEFAAELVRAAGCHPKTKGKELAVVLHDPVGLTAELNAIRMFRNDVIIKELQKPSIAHPLQSSSALRGIEKSFVDASQLQSFDKVSPRGLKGIYTSEHRAAGGVWVPITQKEKDELLAPQKCSSAYPRLKHYLDTGGHGRVVFPDQDSRQAAWIKEQTAKMWEKISPHYDQKARLNWEVRFNIHMQRFHYDPLEKYELDWRAAVDDQKTLAYFDFHFDPMDPNNTSSHHSPGSVYACENDHINKPAPHTKGKATELYVQMLDKKITDLTAIALRALVGNQQSVVEIFGEQLTGDPGAEENGGMRDKTYDVLKDLPKLKKYSWYSDGVMLFGVGQLTALTGAVIAIAHTKYSAKYMTKLMGYWGMQHALDSALDTVRQAGVHGSARGIAPKIPVLVTMRVSRAAAMEIFENRGGGVSVKTSKKQIAAETFRNLHKMNITILTDMESLRAAGGNAEALAKGGGGEVRMGMASAGKARADAAAKKIVELTEAQFLTLFQTEHSKMVTAVSAVKTVLGSSLGKSTTALTMSIEGRLAFGCVFIQIIGLYNSIKTVQNPKDAKALRDGWFGIYDSSAGLLGVQSRPVINTFNE